MNLLDECCSKRREDSNSDSDGQINFCLCLERFLTGFDTYTYVTISLMHSLCINFEFFLLVDLLFLISNLDSQTGSQWNYIKQLPLLGSSRRGASFKFVILIKWIDITYMVYRGERSNKNANRKVYIEKTREDVLVIPDLFDYSSKLFI